MFNEEHDLEAIINLSYGSISEAEAVTKAVSPDNLSTPLGLSVKTIRKGPNVVTLVKCERNLESFIATIDDLLMSVQVAERTISV